MIRFLLFATALGLTGCGGAKSAPMAGTPESSRTALVSALDGWKAGKTAQEFAGDDALIYFLDDDLNRGRALLAYRIEGEGQALGTGYSYVVTLTLQDASAGKTMTRKVAYTAVTEPKQVVTREDRQP
jgi:hypothetical protein